MSLAAPAMSGTEAPISVPMKSAVLPAVERLQSGEIGPIAAATDDAWKAVLDRVVPCCVVLKGAAPVLRRTICQLSTCELWLAPVPSCSQSVLFLTGQCSSSPFLEAVLP